MRRLSIPTQPQRRGMATGPAVIGAILWCAVIIWVVVIWNQDPAEQPNPLPQESTVADQQDTADAQADAPDSNQTTPTTLTINTAPQRIPDFTLRECLGDELTLNDLIGRPWVASFIFTRCRYTCPTISKAVKDLHDRVKEKNPDVMFVTMTVDPAADTVDVMKEYSEIYDPDYDRWKFVTGDVDYIRDLIVNGFGIYVKENLGSARRPGMEVAHSNRVVLVNADGMAAGTFLGTNEAEMAELARILLGSKPFPDPVAPIRISTPDGGVPGVEIQVVPAGSGEPDNSEDQAEESKPNDATPPGIDASNVPATMSTSERVARIERLLPKWAGSLPTANALLNTTSTVLLTLGWFAIRRNARDTHRNLMISAFVVSVAFLACYLTSHWALDHYAGERGRPFVGTGVARVVYYSVLVPHVVLAATVPVLAIRVFQHAAREHWDKHRKLARVTFPIWLYVSVTGVVIYFMLYHWHQAA